LRSKLAEILKRLAEKHGIQCNVSLEELLAYLSGPSYEDDRTSLNKILEEELLLLHEVVEICFLKNMSYKINEATIQYAYPDTYRAHLEAMSIELDEAKRIGRISWVEKRCRDLEEYLDDPHLPRNLEPLVHMLINSYCSRTRRATNH